MKKISFVLIMATVFSIVTTQGKAQLFLAKMAGEMAVKHVIKHTFLKPGKEKEAASVEAKEAAKTEKAAYKLKKANTRAAKNFSREFNNQPDAEWNVGDKFITANYKNDDVKTTAVYDKRGNWLNTMLVYPEAKMPADVRRTVKREYRNYNITQVQEVKENDQTFYVVHLLDGNKYKEVCVYDGEMAVLKEFTQE